MDITNGSRMVDLVRDGGFGPDNKPRTSKNTYQHQKHHQIYEMLGICMFVMHIWQNPEGFLRNSWISRNPKRRGRLLGFIWSNVEGVISVLDLFREQKDDLYLWYKRPVSCETRRHDSPSFLFPQNLDNFTPLWKWLSEALSLPVPNRISHIYIYIYI